MRHSIGLLAGICLLSEASTVLARSVVDAAGRQVDLPAHIERAAGTAPPPTLLVYIVAPELLASVDTPVESSFFASGTKFLLPEFKKLPAVGGWHGAARGANMESLLALDPQVVIAWRNSFVMEPVLRSFEKVHVPVVFVEEDRVADIPGAIRLVGKVLDREARGDALAKDAERRISQVREKVALIPEDKRLRVYYAVGPDGLMTQFGDSFHYDPILMAGGKSVFPGDQKTMGGLERISLEEILIRNPEVIVTPDAEFFASVGKDSRWAGVKAVRDNRVYLVPRDPLNFIDRPPSFMRILGIQWLADVLYPDGDADLVGETISFYRDYLHVAISAEEARTLLGR
ncbi:iron complex transport system substrate-binding protein [Terrimicrobium sacchariphilum]|uniref:Iron complex transport system substrate-binding protein n=1 Tax=Terrimicrobium sacchariphilum TaxID=690879 RepID=A0A146G9L8_TERSA|nr:ABC transporter substrate-binding protein [Terrimicrobium sacchariphilum]GAT33973.1 iron complex transport system substrate-binding protein [Terrimicrobium sacchariphilum]